MAEGYIDTGKTTGTFTLNDNFTSVFQILEQKVDTINGVFVRVYVKLKALQAVSSGEIKVGKITNVNYKENIKSGVGCIVNNANTTLLGGALASNNDVYINCQSGLVEGQTINFIIIA